MMTAYEEIWNQNNKLKIVIKKIVINVFKLKNNFFNHLKIFKIDFFLTNLQHKPSHNSKKKI